MVREGAQIALTREPGNLPREMDMTFVGCDESQEIETMTAKTKVLSHDQSRARIAASAMFAIVLGTFLVFAAGFAHSATIHNAAHDSRHSFSFPCH